MKNLLHLVPRAAGNREVLVVAGAKGGVGASATAALLAAASAAGECNTLLVDSSGGAGPLDLLLGLAPLASDVADQRSDIAPQLSLVRVPVRGTTSAERRLRFRRVLSNADDAVRIVIDAGSRVDEVLAACQEATRLAVVTQRDRIGLAAAYALFKAIWYALPQLDAGLVLNGCSPEEGQIATEIVRSAALHFIGRDVGTFCVLPHDAPFAALVEGGTPLERLRLTELGTAADHAAPALFAQAAAVPTHLRIRNG